MTSSGTLALAERSCGFVLACGFIAGGWLSLALTPSTSKRPTRNATKKAMASGGKGALDAGV
eukprot:CAMPEP_0197630314 /NCGR_PEP_ID=MMETSP1338-20131121/7845_1 /TAXON_ID=43686 ORGANISM="Pelagodinium beii, Strain RCC1491" /NCGR_SAMPLE_ID=MMETSP1338 /ASSEMBLY_ACC=CAM_ASM_000754 /LENGTH=61 /DNA_ID=CAMNT_0043201507 /DNA_START=57 /DNA_END=242 /DNA_ORIENTATION=-